MDNMKNLIIDSINNFVFESKHNRILTTDTPYFEKPLVKFAVARDSLFEEYKQIIGPFHQTPHEAFEMEFGEGSFHTGTVISIVLPVSEIIRKSNRSQKDFSSIEWALLRTFGDEFFIHLLTEHIITLLKQQGFRALAPSQSKNFKTTRTDAGPTSNWSERHIAYVAGQGSFSLNDGFITERGMAVRMTSIVTDAILDADKRTVKHHTENCLFCSKGSCGACIKRCPAGAISKDGHDKNKCFAFVYSEEARQRAVALGGEYKFSAGCGLCQTKVPCEFNNPRAKNK
ncbi:hypothetical protein [uncultured Bacteroides sp.]|uniref:hypothetical protein n=1 Tax=uncultured Bacteroides sp. TaxID=162156 RepID=UPI002AA87E55|nr:hypothetical protein [uncultured Bacteroides sp.]